MFKHSLSLGHIYFIFFVVSKLMVLGEMSFFKKKKLWATSCFPRSKQNVNYNVH